MAGEVRVSQSCEIEMDALIKVDPVPNLRVYLAEERTFLSWMRSGTALMGFGFVVVRVGIFGDSPQVTHLRSADQPHGPSVWFGAALIAIGANSESLCRMALMRLASELNRHHFVDRSLSKQRVIVAFLLALLGIAMTFYLFLAQLPHALHAPFVSMATGH